MKKFVKAFLSTEAQLYLGILSIVVAMFTFTFAAPGQTALNLTGVTVDTAPVFDLALIVITAIAAIWGIKKVIKLGNRS